MCSDGGQIEIVSVPYVFRYLVAELAAMNIVPTDCNFKTDDFVLQKFPLLWFTCQYALCAAPLACNNTHILNNAHILNINTTLE